MSHLGGADDSVASALLPGTTLNEYRIGAVLGQGGFGITYLATDLHLDEEVAIKEYFPRDVAMREGDLSTRARAPSMGEAYNAGLMAFIDEARIIARLRHPNIVQVRRFFEARGTAYIVLDYVVGRSLEDVMDDAPLSEDAVLSIMAGILRGLETVHARAILHRDLKPRNVIVRDDGTPVILDFGAARDFGTRNQHTVTHIASSGYSPPEQYGVGGQHGPWSDLYALGAIAYRGVTGRVPTDSLRRLRDDPLVPAIATEGYSTALLRMIDRLIAVDAQDRPVSVAEVHGSLPGLGTAATVPLAPGARRAAPARWALEPSRPPRHSSQRRGIILAAAASAVLISGGSAALLWHDRHASGEGTGALHSGPVDGDVSMAVERADASSGNTEGRSSVHALSDGASGPSRHVETAGTEAPAVVSRGNSGPAEDGTGNPRDGGPAASAGGSVEEPFPEGLATKPRPARGSIPDSGEARQAHPPGGAAPTKRFIAHPGETIRVRFYYALSDSCTPMGWPRIQIRLRPILGKVMELHGTGHPNYPERNPRHVCNDREQPADVVTYRAPQASKGFDHFVLDVVFPDGRTVVQSFVIDLQ